MDTFGQSIGHTLGQESIAKILEQTELYCEHEKKRIEYSNLPALKAGQAELALLLERKEQLEERIRQLPPEGDLRTRRREALACWVLVGFLVAAGTYFTKLSFEPCRPPVLIYIR
jgi:hypothetical protein